MSRKNGSRSIKRTWLHRAVETYNFHCKKLEENESWTIEDTATTLRRSTGSISEDLLITSWLKTHESKIKEFKYAYQALEFIRDKKKRMMIEICID